MTLSDDLSFSKNSGGFEDVSSSYPVAFGITFTPQVIGIVIGGLGVLGAAYMIVNMVMPAWESFQKKQTQSSALQQQVAKKTTQANQAPQKLAELTKTKKQQEQVLALFANEKSLDTLLLDTSRLVESSNAQVLAASDITAKLRKFRLDGDRAEIIEDSSLGELVNNKLKRQIIKVEIEGKFPQIQSIMRNIERLQPLLLIQNYQSKLLEPKEDESDQSKQPVRTEIGNLSTSFDLIALMPLTAEEAAEISAKEAKKATKRR